MFSPQYNVREIFSTKRHEIEQAIEEELVKRLAGDGVQIRAVFLGNVDLPPEYRAGMARLLAEELSAEKMRYTLELKEKQVKESGLDADAEKVRREKEAEALGQPGDHRRQGPRRGHEARAALQGAGDRAAPARSRGRQGDAPQGRRGRSRGAAASRPAVRPTPASLADAEAYRLEVTGKASSEQMAREGAVVSQNPLLIQKTLADKLSDKIQVIIAPPQAGFVAGGLIGLDGKVQRGSGSSRLARRATFAPARRLPGRGGGLSHVARSRRLRPRHPGSDCAACGSEQLRRKERRPLAGRCPRSARRSRRLPPGVRPSTGAGGYVLETSVRRTPSDTTRPAAVLETVRFLRDVPGLEALGIGHAALYLKLAEPREIDGEIFDALGTMADRLARRASSRSARPDDAALAGQLDVVRSYGVHLESVESEGFARTCYDGEAFRQVLDLVPATAVGSPAGKQPMAVSHSILEAQGGAGRAARGTIVTSGSQTQATTDTPSHWAVEALARAALGLSRPGCEPGGDAQRLAYHERGAEALDRVVLDSLPPLVRHRIHLRRASVWSSLAHARARRGNPEAAQAAARRALDEIALVPRAEIGESDADAMADAFLRTAAVRSATDEPTSLAGGLLLRSTPRAPGETCLVLQHSGKDGDEPLLEHCTYAVVWLHSARAAANASVVVVAVQPLDGWRELLVFRRVAGKWIAEAVSPSTEVGLGYVEWAGWTPDGKGLLVAREARVGGKLARSFELLDVASLTVTRRAQRPGDLTPFQRWSAPEWRQHTLALR